MGVIAFDPGVSTGGAVIGDAGEVIETSVGRTVDDARKMAFRWAQDYPGFDVVAEASPSLSGNYRAHTQQVENIVTEVFPATAWVNPSQWKGTPASRGAMPDGLTQHEKDAVSLGRWYRKMYHV